MSADPRLLVQPAPFLRPTISTPRIMIDVLIALAPCVGVAIWLFGLSALAVLVAATAGSVATEWLLARGPRGESLGDWTAVVTGVLLGLTLPPSFPLWMAALGGFVAIALGKLAWGGLGHNLFNPALVGRAFLQAAFPIAITTWVPPAGPLALYRGNFAWPLLAAPADAVTAATPLGRMKFLGEATPLGNLFWGDVGGSLGETSALALLAGLVWMLARRACDWRIPAAVALSAGGARRGDPQARARAAPRRALHVARRRSPLRHRLHGDRSRDLADLASGRLDLRRRSRRARRPHPFLGRPAGGCDVRDPADERGEPADRQGVAAACLRLRSARALGGPARRCAMSGPERGGSGRLVATLALAGLLSGLAIVSAYRLTLPRIRANQAAALERAVFEVLPGATRMGRWVWRGAGLEPAGGPGGALDESLFAGFTDGGQLLGWAVPAAGAGFQDTIKLIYGLEPDGARIVGMAVLESRETPGLGDRIYKDPKFVAEFLDLATLPEIALVQGHGVAPNEVDAITGATISSRAVVRILNASNARWRERLPDPAGVAPSESPAGSVPADVERGGPVPGGPTGGSR